MNPTDPDRPELTPEEERLVRLVDEASRAPAPGAAQRVAFNAALERRLARPRRRGLGAALAAAAGAALAALLLFAAGGPPATGPRGEVPAATASGVMPEEALLALENEPAVERDASLPDDYLAIESLLLGG